MAAGTFAISRQSSTEIGRTGIVQMNPPTRILLTAAFSLLSVLAAQAAPTRITARQNITLPGSYILANDITRSSGSAIITIEIQASDVTLNLNGHTINASGGEGILIDSNDINNNGSPVINVHVSNGQIVGASAAYHLYSKHPRGFNFSYKGRLAIRNVLGN
jgi:hypothetical protein